MEVYTHTLPSVLGSAVLGMFHFWDHLLTSLLYLISALLISG